MEKAQKLIKKDKEKVAAAKGVEARLKLIVNTLNQVNSGEQNKSDLEILNKCNELLKSQSSHKLIAYVLDNGWKTEEKEIEWLNQDLSAHLQLLEVAVPGSKEEQEALRAQLTSGLEAGIAALEAKIVEEEESLMQWVNDVPLQLESLKEAIEKMDIPPEKREALKTLYDAVPYPKNPTECLNYPELPENTLRWAQRKMGRLNRALDQLRAGTLDLKSPEGQEALRFVNNLQDGQPTALLEGFAAIQEQRKAPVDKSLEALKLEIKRSDPKFLASCQKSIKEYETYTSESRSALNNENNEIRGWKRQKTSIFNSLDRFIKTMISIQGEDSLLSVAQSNCQKNFNEINNQWQQDIKNAEKLARILNVAVTKNQLTDEIAKYFNDNGTIKDEYFQKIDPESIKASFSDKARDIISQLEVALEDRSFKERSPWLTEGNGANSLILSNQIENLENALNEYFPADEGDSTREVEILKSHLSNIKTLLKDNFELE